MSVMTKSGAAALAVMNAKAAKGECGHQKPEFPRMMPHDPTPADVLDLRIIQSWKFTIWK